MHFNFALLCIIASLANFIAAQNLPSQIHIALAGNDGAGNSNGMAVSWQTVNRTLSSVVKYGIASGVYSAQNKGSCAAYYEVNSFLTISEKILSYF